MSRGQSVLGTAVGLSLTTVILVANAVGAAVVLVLAGWVLPTGPMADPAGAQRANITLVVAYLAVAAPVGVLWGRRGFRRKSGDGATQVQRERRVVLYGPLRVVTGQAVLWAVAAVLFWAINLQYGPRLGIQVGETILLGGIANCALVYLLTERILRQTTARVLREVPSARRVLPGILTRSVLFWALGTGVPIVGLMLAGAEQLIYRDISGVQLGVIMVALGGTALISGFLVTVGAARAVADPVRAVRQEMRRVEEGDLGAHAAVYDGAELGRLQASFNRMVVGLRERERLRDLFGRQVGRDVASVAVAADEVRLGGELRGVAVLFVDLVGSTALAARLPPTEVVGLLNRFFSVVVDVVEECGGWINKFEGDAALAVFGAPADHPDAAGGALAAGRMLARRLPAEVPEVAVGIGVSAGNAVAGNVGSMRRFEYTVIGDPVNEAARLTEFSKQLPGRLCASARAVALAAVAEAAHWQLGEEEQLRGRASPTRIAVPRDLQQGDIPATQSQQGDIPATRAGHTR
jgi:adenylate cyclase